MLGIIMRTLSNTYGSPCHLRPLVGRLMGKPHQSTYQYTRTQMGESLSHNMEEQQIWHHHCPRSRLKPPGTFSKSNHRPIQFPQRLHSLSDNSTS